MMKKTNPGKKVAAGFIAIVLTLGLMAQSAPASTGVITSGVVNVRGGPGTEYVKRGTLLKGASVNVLSEGSVWSKVVLRNGTTGWVRSSLIRINRTTASVTNAAKPQKSGGTVMQVEVTGRIGSLRQGPGTNYRLLARAQKGETFPFISQTGQWYKIKTKNGIAYIASFLTRVTSTQVAMAAEPTRSESTPGGNVVPPTVAPAATSAQTVPTPAQSSTANNTAIPVPGQFDSVSVPQSVNGSTPAAGTAEGVSNVNDGVDPTKIKIVLDAGHGGTDPGAKGATGSQEKDVNLTLVRKVESLLTQEGFSVRLTRSDDQYVGLYDRSNIANAESADLFVSIHCNSAPTRDRHGTSTYYYINQADPVIVAQTEQRKKLAETMLQALVEKMGLSNEGVRQAAFVVIRETRIPAILIETAYINNPNEEVLLHDSAFQDQVAAGVKNGIRRYLALHVPLGPITSAQVDLSQFTTVTGTDQPPGDTQQ